MSNLKGKVTVITGAGGVLCGAIARRFGALGAKIAVVDLSYDKAEAVARDICARGGIAEAYGADCLDKASLEVAREKISADLGACDLLINGAGGNHPRASTTCDFYDAEDTHGFFDLDVKDVDFVFKLNFLTAFAATQVFAADMTHGGGNIINVSSMNAFTPLTRISAYSAAKAALSNFTQWLAVHFAKSGIRVNAVAPGFFVTEQNRELLFDADGKPSERSRKILANTPMGRFGKPDELFGVLEWLADDDEAAFVTGVVIPVDGGFSAYSGV